MELNAAIVPLCPLSGLPELLLGAPGYIIDDLGDDETSAILIKVDAG
jgi:hypothetical protein